MGEQSPGEGELHPSSLQPASPLQPRGLTQRTETMGKPQWARERKHQESRRTVRSERRKANQELALEREDVNEERDPDAEQIDVN